MVNPEMSQRRILVEWYGRDVVGASLADAVARLGAAAAKACGAPVRLLLAVGAPTDEVVYGVFSADSDDAVCEVCRSAGCPPDRVVDRVDTWAAG
ncbi:hypothetical protein [Mycolicibacterium insubricum]|uniref:hypothetical protein n=1 Tax=Mycolicibacterium insubricum TaxID=444597 RepID=UPI0021F2C12C|nr:hypothetical protein [Mycolicibacterium insubricum]MCV7081692.1 hypothetical protein [Mycolicibacterium insubricum]